MMTHRAIPDNHYASLASLEDGYWWFTARVAWARRLVNAWSGSATASSLTYADLGCGTGGFARQLDEAFSFSKVILVDSNQDALKRIQFPKASVIAADLSPGLRLPLTPNLITMMDVIEHVPNAQTLVKTAAGLLAPGGLLIVSVPAHQMLYSSWDTQLGHVRRYSRHDLASIVENTGLTIRTLRPMWSFLALPALLRKFETRPADTMHFPKVSPTLNSMLIRLSNLEWSLPSLPFGTSWILSAEKK